MRPPIISRGNSKLGELPNISLPPVITCPDGVPCATGGCYALKAWRMYPNVRAAWKHNLACYQEEPDLYFYLIGQWLAVERPALFRWHVAGDIPHPDYVEGMVQVADECPETGFLAFTKRYAWLNTWKRLPDNLSIVFSAWPGYPMPATRYPVAYLAEDTRRDGVPAVECTGGCDTCGACWQLGRSPVPFNVVFHRH